MIVDGMEKYNNADKVKRQNLEDRKRKTPKVHRFDFQSYDGEQMVDTHFILADSRQGARTYLGEHLKKHFSLYGYQNVQALWKAFDFNALNESTVSFVTLIEPKVLRRCAMAYIEQIANDPDALEHLISHAKSKRMYRTNRKKVAKI
jgi:hypothetical protein